MDILDVSAEPNHAVLLESKRQMLLAAQEEKGKRLQLTMSRHQLVSRYRQGLMMRKEEFTSAFIFIPPSYASCTRSLNDLVKIMIHDFHFETNHKGSYVPLRSIVPPRDRLSSVVSIVEDEEGSVLMFSLYHQGIELQTKYWQKGLFSSSKNPT
jgi:hypothetical protein